MVWYLDTSAFLKLVIAEPESAALRTWVADDRQLWSSHLLRSEALRACARFGLDAGLVDDALASVSLILPSASTFRAAGSLPPAELRTLDALHLATALELGSDLAGVVTYDQRMAAGASALGMRPVGPR